MARVEKQKQQSENKMIMKALSDMTAVIKSISEEQKTSQLAIQNILDGLEVTKSIEDVVQKSKPMPTANLDNAAVLSEITNVLKGMQEQAVNKDRPQHWDVSKSRGELASVLPSLLRK